MRATTGAFIYDIEVRTRDGAVVERWDGLHLRAVARAPRLPAWPEPLLATYLERRLEPLDRTLRVAVTTDEDASRVASARTRRCRVRSGARSRSRHRPDGRP